MKRETLIDLQKLLNKIEPFKLSLGSTDYLVTDALSESGGSCIAYIAERVPNKSELQDIQRRKNVIKEFFPLSLSDSIKRNNDGSLDFSACEAQFTEKKARFLNGCKELADFFTADSNHSLNGTLRFYDDINATAYSVMDMTHGEVLQKVDREHLSACDIAQIMVSLCNVVNKFHKQKKLYLDVKPDNVFLFDWENHESRRIALFDFDTVEEIGKLRDIGNVTKEYANKAQRKWDKFLIDEGCDAFSIGMLFYWLLTGEADSKHMPTLVAHRFDGLDNCPKLYGKNDPSTKTAREILFTIFDDGIKDLEQLTERFNDLNNDSKTSREDRTNSSGIKEANTKLNDILEIVSYNSTVKTNQVIVFDDIYVSGIFNNTKNYYEKLTNENGKYAYFENNDKLFPYAHKTVNANYKRNSFEFSLNQITEVKGNFILIGEGGVGKTTALLVAWKKFLESTNYIPFYISLNDYNNCYSDNEKQNFISEYLILHYSFNIYENFKCDSEINFVLLLDGLNEIFGDNKPIIAEIRSLYIYSKKKHLNIQFIFTSRYDLNSAYSFDFVDKYDIQPLSNKSIDSYLNDSKVYVSNVPYDILRTPMMLSLYTNTYFEKSRFMIKLNFLENNTIGELIYNFLLCQLGKVNTEIQDDRLFIVAISIFIVAPYLAYSIESEGRFDFDKFRFRDLISNSITMFERYIPQLINEKFSPSFNFKYNIERDILITNVEKVLTKEIAILVENSNNISFRHQHFRDFLSAYHIINTLKKEQINNDENLISTELVKRLLPRYVASMIGDCLQEYKNTESTRSENVLQFTFNKLRYRSGSDYDLILNNIILIYKISRNNNLTNVNFDNIDLRNIPLNGIVFSKNGVTSIFTNSIISESTFMPTGHVGQVRSVCFNETESTILSAGGTVIKEWDTITGLCLKTYYGHKNLVNSANYSPCGLYIVSASNDNTVKIWDRETGYCLHTLDDHKKYVTSAIYSNQGYVLTSSWDGTVFQYKFENGIWNKSTIGTHDKNVKAISYNNDYRYCISSSGDTSIIEWNIENSRSEYVYKHHSSMVNSAKYSADNKFIVSGGYDNKVFVWQRFNNKPLMEYDNGYWVRDVVFSKDHLKIYVASQDGLIKELNCNDTLTLTGVFIGHKKAVTKICLNKDETCILSSSEDGSIMVWDIITRQCIQVINGFDFSTTETIYSSDGELVLTIRNKNVTVSERKTATTTDKFIHDSNVKSAVFSPDDNYILTTSSYTSQNCISGVIEWERSINCKRTYKVNENCDDENPIYASYSPEGTKIIVLYTNSTNKSSIVRIFRKNDFSNCVNEYHLDELFSIVKLSDDSFITFSNDGIIRKYDLLSGVLIQVLGVSIKDCTFFNAVFTSKLSKYIIKISSAKYDEPYISSINSITISHNKPIHDIILYSENIRRHSFLFKEIVDCFSVTKHTDSPIIFSDSQNSFSYSNLLMKYPKCYFRHINLSSAIRFVSSPDIDVWIKQYDNIFSKIYRMFGIDIKTSDDLDDEWNALIFFLLKTLLQNDKEQITDVGYLNSGFVFWERFECGIPLSIRTTVLHNLINIFPNYSFLITSEVLNKDENTDDFIIIDIDK